MYCEFKNKEWWVWSSRLASLDCIPQYKVNADSANDALLSVSALKQLLVQKKDKIKRKEKNRLYYKFRIKPVSTKNKNLYEWAANLNN